ncbi:uncharacterized protein LOC130736149 [Lotus japonicus]|uniref:uncharacterized protein LOC130736149 n=1 Tax=Lotus japonicus TaxID=34305 RepID=UPI0025873DA9|nr:uncharacterized protein LOC130736149 [Lotus japonicus]
MQNVDNISQRNEYLQEQLELFRHEQQDEGVHEAEVVAEFEPFSAEVQEVAFPDNMKNLVLESYSGRIDSKDHLLYFNTKIVISPASDAVKCRMFPSTFKSMAMAWCTTFPRGSITNFRDFSSKFLIQFSARKVRLVMIDNLYNLRQFEGETLKQYMARYNATSVKIEDSEPCTYALEFKNGLLPGSLNSKLSGKPARSMVEIRARANTYILDEEDDAFKRRHAKKEGDGALEKQAGKERRSEEKGIGSKHREKKGKSLAKFVKEQLYLRWEALDHRRPWQPHGSHRWEEDMELNTHLTDILREVKATHMVGESDQREPPPRSGIDKTKWCEDHRSVGHDTDDFFTLQREIEKLIKLGRLKQYDRGGRQQGDRQQGNRDRETASKEIANKGTVSRQRRKIKTKRWRPEGEELKKPSTRKWSRWSAP